MLFSGGCISQHALLDPLQRRELDQSRLLFSLAPHAKRSSRFIQRAQPQLGW
jgi:hypothetical protein